MHLIIIEALIVGLVIAVVGIFISMIPYIKGMNKKYKMPVLFFVVGAVSHISFEVAGFNKWYCLNGYACK